MVATGDRPWPRGSLTNREAGGVSGWMQSWCVSQWQGRVWPTEHDTSSFPLWPSEVQHNTHGHLPLGPSHSQLSRRKTQVSLKPFTNISAVFRNLSNFLSSFQTERIQQTENIVYQPAEDPDNNLKNQQTSVSDSWCPHQRVARCLPSQTVRLVKSRQQPPT